jgi:hypothetical protein
MKPLNRFQKVRPHRAYRFGPFKCTTTTYYRLNSFCENLVFTTRFVLGAIAVVFTIFVPSSLLLFHFSLFNACLAVLALCVGIIFITITLP